MAGDFDIGPADYEADMSENGKGDTPRPIVVDQETYKKNWEQTFSKTESVINETPEVIDWSMHVIKVPITLRRPLETLGDPPE